MSTALSTVPDTHVTACVTELLSVMPEGIGDLTFASPEWVDAAREVLHDAVRRHTDALSGVKFTLCEVGRNPPAYLHAGGKLAWHVKFDGANVDAQVGELPEADCDLKIEGDHSIMSNLGRLLNHGKDPDTVSRVEQRLIKLSRWRMSGKKSEHKILRAVLRTLHDTMAPRTMPRFVFMTPAWVSIARHVVSTRAASEKYRDGLRDIVFTFSEEFTDTPAYGFPGGSHGGFWVHCNHGQITVGAGPLPSEYEPADFLTKGPYTPIVPVGRTVNRALTEAEQQEVEQYRAAAFKPDPDPVMVAQGTSPSGKGDMPIELARVMVVLHDEISKRTSGELPSDFDDSLRPAWSTAPRFDRDPDYDPTWLRYDKVDIHGRAR